VERPRVLFDDDVPAVYRDDAGDLVRLDIGRIALPDTAFSAPSPRYPANDRLAAAPQACDVAIVPAGKQPPPWLKAAAVLRTRAASARALATAVNG
jgi:hypothetical protein